MHFKRLTSLLCVILQLDKKFCVLLICVHTLDSLQKIVYRIDAAENIATLRSSVTRLAKLGLEGDNMCAVIARVCIWFQYETDDFNVVLLVA